MKKKVVAMVTLAMFIMTLLPMAAFAGTAPAADRSSISTTYDNVEVDVNEAVELEVSVLDKDGKATTELLNGVTVWATNKEGKNVDSVVFEGSSGTKYPGVLKASLENNEKIKVSFAQPGEYTINATADVNGKDVALKQVADRQVVIVNSVDQDKVTFGSNVTMDKNDKYVGTVVPNIQFNGIDKMVITGQLFNKEGQPILDQDITLSSNKSALVLKDETVTTGENGEFNIEFAMTDEVNAAITVNTGELEYTLKVLANADSAEKIKVIKDGGVVLATNDDNWKNVADSKFIDAVQFEITDKNGNVLEGDQADQVFIAGTKKVMSITKPNASTLAPENLKLVWNEDKSAYTFALVDSVKAGKTLVAGDYTVKVALDNDATATASFKVAKFGDKEKLVVTPYAKFDGNAASKYVEVKDQIRLGCDLGLKAEYVDANGLSIPADTAVLGAEGEAIVKSKGQLGDYTVFDLYESNPAYDSLIGTTITVKGYDKEEKLQAENVVLTVVKDYSEYELAFDPAEGNVNKDNTVNVSVVDKDGRVAKQLNGTVDAAWVVKQSNKDAKVTVDTKKKVTNGKGELTVYSTHQKYQQFQKYSYFQNNTSSTSIFVFLLRDLKHFV